MAPVSYTHLGQILGHFLGERGDQNPFSLGPAGVDLSNEIVDLAINWTDNDLRIEQTGRADDLLDHLTLSLIHILPSSRATAISSLAVMPESTVMSRRVPCSYSCSIAGRVRP